MVTYVATFFAHIGTIRFKKYCDGLSIEAKMQPVPRTLSSSCGTCVVFHAPDDFEFKYESDEIEGLYKKTDDGYETVFET